MYPEYNYNCSPVEAKHDALGEVQAKIFVEGLKKIKDYHDLFDMDSPVNEETKEILGFSAWFKTIKLDKYDYRYLPDFITNNLNALEIKNLFKPYLLEEYNEYIKSFEEDEIERLKNEKEEAEDAE